MSIFSDYKCGAITREEFEGDCNAMNNRERWELSHMSDCFEDEDEDEDYESDYEDC